MIDLRNQAHFATAWDFQHAAKANAAAFIRRSIFAVVVWLIWPGWWIWAFAAFAAWALIKAIGGLYAAHQLKSGKFPIFNVNNGELSGDINNRKSSDAADSGRS